MRISQKNWELAKKTCIKLSSLIIIITLQCAGSLHVVVVVLYTQRRIILAECKDSGLEECAKYFVVANLLPARADLIAHNELTDPRVRLSIIPI